MDLYAATIPHWSNSLRCLKNILAKAMAHAEQQGYEAEVLLSSRLFPDMFEFTRQVQIACDITVRGGARLAQQALPEFPDTESSMTELVQRIDGALAFLGDLNQAGFSGAHERQIDVPAGGDTTIPMSGQQYVFSFSIPNLYFHITTAYNLLRSNGVPVGKRDFLMPTPP